MKRGIVIAAACVVLVNITLFLYIILRPVAPATAPRAAGVATQESATVRAPAGGGTEPRTYFATGFVREVRADGSNVVIRHDEIPGFMMAMSMPFTVRDPRELSGINPGDRVTFRLLVTEEDSWIDSVQRISAGAEPEPPAFQHARIVRDVEPLEIGDVMPDYTFTNELGRPVQLSDYRGKVVALTFIFTRCPLPDYCPRIINNFSTVTELLSADATAPTNWHLVTMTIDPAFDTPEVLRRYARAHNYDPSRWTFLTGAMIDIDAITEQVGMVYRRATPTALPDHNLRTVVIDPEGRLRTIIVGNTWDPAEVVAHMKEAVEAKPVE